MVAIEIIGNIGADVKRVDTNGTTFYTFNICDNRKVNGEEKSQWYGISLNKPSENLLKYLVKGQNVFVRGIPRYRVFDSAKYHCKMVAIDVMANEIQLVGKAPEQEESSEGDSAAQQQVTGDAADPSKGGKQNTQETEKDLPF